MNDDVTFTAPGGTFSITVGQMAHALDHYHAMLPGALAECGGGTAKERASAEGLMGACISHALGWTAEEGLLSMLADNSFQALLVLAIEMYADALADGLFDEAGQA